jgi:hypothetical protein
MAIAAPRQWYTDKASAWHWPGPTTAAAATLALGRRAAKLIFAAVSLHWREAAILFVAKAWTIKYAFIRILFVCFF